MSDERPPEATTRSLALWAGTAPTKADVDRVVREADPATLPLFAVLAKGLRRGVAYIEDAVESRLREEKILVPGERWTHPETGVVHRFIGERVTEVGDPPGLRAALEKAGVPKSAIDRAVYLGWKVSMTELNKIAKASDERREIVEDFVSVRFRPAHLSEEEAGR
jgi:hypothetical protein